MIRRPPRSTLDRSSAASDVYKRQKGFLLAQVGQPNPTLDPEALEDGWSNRSENGDTPVSYTHLRAHETVLDLVCRLLLEKKKKTRKHYKYITHTYNTKKITSHTTHLREDIYLSICKSG